MRAPADRRRGCDREAKLNSLKSWRTSKSPMAAYWADAAVIAGHCARFVRARATGVCRGQHKTA